MSVVADPTNEKHSPLRHWGPRGAAPDLGSGTWVRSMVDLSELKGQRIKLRFLVSSIRVAETWQDFGDGNPTPEEDGWWIDDLTIDETLSVPAQLVIDTNVLMQCAGDSSVGCLTDGDCTDSGVSGPCLGDAPQCPVVTAESGPAGSSRGRAVTSPAPMRWASAVVPRRTASPRSTIYCRSPTCSSRTGPMPATRPARS